jgi:hypothetical protein
MNGKRKLLAAAAGAVLSLGGIAAGLAATSSTAGAAVKPAVAQVPAQTPTTTTQQGDQTTPDAPGSASAEKETAPGVEASGAEEPGDASLPGGGHADASGQNVDTQFEGVQ